MVQIPPPQPHLTKDNPNGGVAQLVRAAGSYPAGRWFESDRRYQIRPHGQVVKTSPFHGGNRSSNLLGVTIQGSIAQLGERLPYKQDVTGSSPVVPTKDSRRFQMKRLFVSPNT